MKYISLFSGIEAATVAWSELGWEPLAFCEIDDFPSAVLSYHYPDVPNLGDITQVNWKDVIERYGRPDVVVGGSPCQSFSVAGGRESLGGESRLMFEYIRALAEIRPKWFLWENVPGVLNTRDNAFVQLLREVQDIGYLSLAWRVLDAQFFGVAQRRRRVFLVGHLGSGGGAAAVLFESESVRGNTQTSKQKREELARAAGRGAKACGSAGFCFNAGNTNGVTHIGESQVEISPTIRASRSGTNGTPSVLQSAGFCGYASHTAKSIGYEEETAPTLKGNDWQCQVPDVLQTVALQTGHTAGNGSGFNSDDVSYTLSLANDHAVAFAQNTRDEVRLQGGDGSVSGPIAASDSAKGQGVPFVMASGQANAEIADDGTSPTITCLHEQPIVCMADDNQKAAIDENLSGTLKVGGGYTSSGVLASNGDEVIGALCARDHKGVGNEYVSEGKVICQRAKS